MDGRMQVSTARNVGMAPSQCPTTEAPGPYFQKEFFHNGYIKSLKQLVHFYNTRDVFPYPVTSGHCPAGTTEKVDCWPMAEIPNNVDMSVGSLGLTDEEEDQLVLILQALTDGFDPANPTVSTYPNINTFTGTCKTGGSASTQGNESLIPTPPLPPCAAAVCGVAASPQSSRLSRRGKTLNGGTETDEPSETWTHGVARDPMLLHRLPREQQSGVCPCIDCF